MCMTANFTSLHGVQLRKCPKMVSSQKFKTSTEVSIIVQYMHQEAERVTYVTEEIYNTKEINAFR
jgi:hypothetical protein